MNKFYTAISLLQDMYGIELDEDLFETYALTAWNKIGNKQTRLYRTKLYPTCSPEGGSYVAKPCNLDRIEAITLGYEDAKEIDSLRNYAGSINRPIEEFIESRKRETDSLYLPGKLVHYYEQDDKIYFTEVYSEVNILYKGIYMDEDGLPLLNDKEVLAIATYCAYVHLFKKGLMTKDQATIQLAQILKKEWLRACDQARISDYISQNQMNDILDVMTSWDRKVYNISYKALK